MNSNKISVIPALIEPTSGTIAKTDKEKAEMLVSWFSQPPQPPSYSEETKEHYQLVGDEITAVIDTKRYEEINHRRRNIEALRYISSHKAQGPDNIHNQMIKNGGQALINSLVVLFNWSFKIGYVPRLWKRANI
ncbi:hypothetical protein RFI_37537, partial [Reticulomyxa filosa]